MMMLSDEDDSLGLFTVGFRPLQTYNYDVGIVNTAGAVATIVQLLGPYGCQHRSLCSQYELLVGYVMFSVDHGVPNVNQPSHLQTQRPRPSHRNHEMTSQIGKISGNGRKINVIRNFIISAFNDIIYPFVLPRCVCFSKLLSIHFL